MIAPLTFLFLLWRYKDLSPTTSQLPSPTTDLRWWLVLVTGRRLDTQRIQINTRPRIFCRKHSSHKFCVVLTQINNMFSSMVIYCADSTHTSLNMLQHLCQRQRWAKSIFCYNLNCIYKKNENEIKIKINNRPRIFCRMHFWYKFCVVLIHMGREHASREKKIDYCKIFDFRAKQCI